MLVPIVKYSVFLASFISVAISVISASLHTCADMHRCSRIHDVVAAVWPMRGDTCAGLCPHLPCCLLRLLIAARQDDGCCLAGLVLQRVIVVEHVLEAVASRTDHLSRDQKFVMHDMLLQQPLIC